MKPIRINALAACIAAFILAASPWDSARAGGLVEPTALEQYVYTPDPAYGYTLTETLEFPQATIYVFLMDSLTWRAADEVDRQLWTHELVLIVPTAMSNGTVFYLINGGSDPLDPLDPLFILAGIPIATSTGSAVAVISQIPNQPLQFADQPAPISEDALVAYSWAKVMDTGDPQWAAYMPMTKASVRGMDATQEFLEVVRPDNPVDGFVVTGFSKRGATSWLVAAVDPRVRAVAPGVFDVLDIPLQIERHYQAYGFYTPAVQDYVDFGIVRRGRSPEGRFLASVVDPISYSELLTLPKLLLNSTGDQFFLPDSANVYLDRLLGETLVSQLPNTDHGFSNGLFDALGVITAWYQTVLAGTPRPGLSWQSMPDGGLVVRPTRQPLSALLWQATNPEARDFRLETLGPAWTQSPLAREADGSYLVKVAPPPSGFTGFLAQFQFPAPDGGVQTYSTPVMVTPDTLPFTLDDPVGAPKSADWWRCQFPDTAGCADPPELTEAELEALLPFPVFGDYLTDLPGLQASLEPALSADDLARRHCTATRLNIAAGDLGWYTSLGPRYLWQRYETIESAFSMGRFRVSARGCASLNSSPE